MVFLIQQTLLFAVPLMIVALAGVCAERSGVINLALEGIMIFGAFIGCIIGAFMILMTDGFIKMLSFIAVFLVLQQLEENFIYPKVVGNSVGLPAIWVFVAVTLGGSAWGVLGMLLFIPLCSVFYALLKENVDHRLKKKPVNKLTGPSQKALIYEL